VIVSVQEITDGGDVEPFELGCDGAVCDVAKDESRCNNDLCWNKW